MFALLLPVCAGARVHRSSGWADSQFASAQRMQEALEGVPLEKRTRRDYERVINAYRRIYLGAPTSGRADPSVVAAAQMTEELGRRFVDADSLRSAIQQYEFLRREYPGSKFRFEALFRIGEVYKDDLHDKKNADATFEEFVRRYPRNQFAETARQALTELAQPQPNRRAQKEITAADKDAKALKPSADADATAVPDNLPNNSGNQTEVPDSGKPSRVIGIRHWSTPDYTRVAIDLEQGVKFESQRIQSPDRIFFDLLNTDLDAKLAGRTFDVGDGLLKDIRTAQFKAGRARVVLDLDELSEFDASLVDNPPRLIIDIHNKPITAEAAKARSIADRENSPERSVPDPISGEALSGEKVAIEKSARRNSVVISNGVKKTIVEADDSGSETPETLGKKGAANLDGVDTENIKPASVDTVSSLPSDGAKSNPKNKRKSAAADFDMREAQPTASGDRSLIRALGLKIGKIVIDPGHGGHDTGTIGPTGLEEKDLVLDVSRRLGKLLQTRIGAEVIYTRKDDTFIPLETRTAIANQEAADLFVSVHANSSHDPDARGVETYYLNFTSSPEALEVAARENAVSEKSIHELQDLVKKIALKEKIEESQEFAGDVQRSLHTGLAAKSPGQRDRGVKKAPFIVLIGANMPSILAEISFLSNPGDEHRLETADYRQKIAESLYRGIAKYVSGLSGVKVASKIDKGEGQ